MSIGIYAFLRIYFLYFGVSDFAQFRTHCAALQPRAPPRSARRRLSGIGCRPVQRVRRPGVCAGAPCLAWSVLHLARPALLPVLCSPSGCAGGWGLHLRGIQGAPGVGQVMPAHSEANKKGVLLANTHPTFTNPNPSDCASLQKFQKIQKGSFRSLDCVIIS